MISRLDDTLQPLKQAYNRGVSKKRFVALLSPT